MQMFVVVVDDPGMAVDMTIMQHYPGKFFKLYPNVFLIEDHETTAPHYVGRKLNIGVEGGLLGIVMAVTFFSGTTRAPLLDWMQRHGYADKAAAGYAEQVWPDLRRMSPNYARREDGPIIDAVALPEIPPEEAKEPDISVDVMKLYNLGGRDDAGT